MDDIPTAAEYIVKFDEAVVIKNTPPPVPVDPVYKALCANVCRALMLTPEEMARGNLSGMPMIQFPLASLGPYQALLTADLQGKGYEVTTTATMLHITAVHP